MSDAQPFLRLAFGLAFEDLYDPAGLGRLDGFFAEELRRADAELHARWLAARTDPAALDKLPEAELLIASRDPLLAHYKECQGKMKVGLQPGQITNHCDQAHFWSLHPSGANFLFADASVRFLNYSADRILPQLATRNLGDSTPEL